MIFQIISWILCMDYPVLPFTFDICLVFGPMFDTFPEGIWPFLSGSLKINRLKRDVDLGSRVVILHPRIKFSKFAANELCSYRKDETLIAFAMSLNRHSQPVCTVSPTDHVYIGRSVQHSRKCYYHNNLYIVVLWIVLKSKLHPQCVKHGLKWIYLCWNLPPNWHKLLYKSIHNWFSVRLNCA